MFIIKLTSYGAIIRYLAKKHGLAGDTPEEIAKIDSIYEHLHEIQFAFFRVIALTPDFEKAKAGYINGGLPEALTVISNFLGQKTFMLGDKITYVDFRAYELLDYFRQFSPETFQKFGNLIEYEKRFEELPAIKKYMSSPDYLDWPLYGPISKWGFKR